jgi:hypothetical protein
MANKYCAHNAYALSATVTATINSGQLVVSAIQSGYLGLNGVITGGLLSTASPALYYVTSQAGVSGNVTGNYGIGNTTGVSNDGTARTYTISAGLPFLTTIPSALWGMPQEGDGLASTPSTAAATVTIDLTGATAAAAATFTVAGAVLTCVASGAGANQFNAGSGATLVANLVSAINAATNTVNAAATGWFAHQLRDAVFARVNPGNTSKLDIMTRAGSAVYNANSLFQVAQASFTGLSSAGPWQFAGGVSGCWGTVFSGVNVSVLPSAMNGSRMYGVWGASPPLAGALNAGDNVYMRANVNVLTGPGNYYDSLTMKPCGSVSNPVSFLIDDGTVWSADGTTPIFTVLSTPLGGRGNNFFAMTDYTLGSGLIRVCGKRYSNGNANLAFKGLVDAYTQIVAPSQLYLEHADVFQALSTFTNGVGINVAGGFYVPTEAHWHDVQLTQNSTGSIYNLNAGNYNTHNFRLTGSQIINTATSATPNVIGISGGNSNSQLVLDGVTFSGFVPGSKLLPGTTSTSVGEMRLALKNCSLGNVAPIPCFAANSCFSGLSLYAASATQFGNRDFFSDTMFGFVEWNSTKSFPTLRALLPDGVTPWSLHAIPTTTAANIGLTKPFELPRISKLNNLATGDRTVTVEFAVEQSQNWNSSNISAIFEYQAADGSIVAVDSQSGALGVTTALTPSTSTWSNEKNGQVYYPIDATYHNKYKFSFSTVPGKQMATGTEFSVTLRIYTSVSNTSTGVFICPELVVV